MGLSLPKFNLIFFKKCLDKWVHFTDYFVGNTKAVLSVGFRIGKSVDFPVSLYSEDVRKLSQPTNKVLAIFAKPYQQQGYIECTYLSKGQEVHKLPLSEEVMKLIQMLPS